MLTSIHIEDTVAVDGEHFGQPDPERHEESMEGCFGGAPVEYNNRYTPEKQFSAGSTGERFASTEWPQMANAVIDALHIFGQQAQSAVAAIIESGQYTEDHIRVTLNVWVLPLRKQILVDLHAEEYLDGNFKDHGAHQTFDMEGKLVEATRTVRKGSGHYRKVFGKKQDQHVAQIARAFLMAMDVFEGA